LMRLMGFQKKNLQLKTLNPFLAFAYWVVQSAKVLALVLFN
jgi:hypothetical protein